MPMRTLFSLATLALLLTGTTLDAPAATAATATDNHAAWCSQNYRSYNSRTDTFTGLDGLAHRCISPFGLKITTIGQVPGDLSAPVKKNPNGPGSGTALRLYPNDSEGGNNGTSGQ